MHPVSAIESKTSQTRSMRGGAYHPTTQIYNRINTKGGVGGFEKLSGTFERPAAACTLAAVARTCHSVQRVALHDISLSRKKLLDVLDA